MPLLNHGFRNACQRPVFPVSERFVSNLFVVGDGAWLKTFAGLEVIDQHRVYRELVASLVIVFLERVLAFGNLSEPNVCNLAGTINTHVGIAADLAAELSALDAFIQTERFGTARGHANQEAFELAVAQKALALCRRV